MKLSNANKLRSVWVQKLMDFVNEQGEDVGVIASNSFNFPVVIDGEEGWVEIVVKIPKEEGDEGFGKREDWSIKCKEKAEKAKAKEEAKAKKIARDKAHREAKAKQRENRGE